MHITAKVNEGNQALADTLAKRGITAKLVKGGVIVELPVSKKGSRNDPDTYKIPAEVAGATLLINVTEHGGGGIGRGTVVCGLSGAALRPYYVPRGGSLNDGTHAHFAVYSNVVTITGYRFNYNVTIEEHWIVRDGNTARIESKTFWSGDLKVLPELFIRFKAAARAATNKGNCLHCRSVHYADLISIAH